MKFNRIADKAKQALDKRGGVDALKEDLQEVKEAATGRGTLKDKAKAAADAIRTPGRNDAPTTRDDAPTTRDDAPTTRDDDPPPPRAA